MIAPATIAAVKDRTDIVALVGESVRLVKRGQSHVGLCPFHQEKTPSFHVHRERGYCHCFGCHAGGGVFDFVMLTQGMTFPEAVRYLAERAGIDVEDTRTDDERREAAAAARQREDLYRVNAVAAVYYERCMLGDGSGAHPLGKYAREELARRGIALPSIDATNAASLFRIGYAPAGWDGLTQYLRRQGISGTLAEQVGLLVPRNQGGGHYDRFRHRLMFPVLDVMGRVVAFSGRMLPPPTADECAAVGVAVPTGDAPAKYINSPESPIYTKGEHLYGLHQARAAIRMRGDAILVEGNLDVVGLHERGITTAVAPLGTAFTAPQAKLLRRFAARTTVLFDGDDAGHKATRAARVPCREAGLTARVGAVPVGQDPDVIARQQGARGIEQIVNGARGMLEYLIDDALDPASFPDASLSMQAQRVEAVMALLRAEQDPTLRGLAKTYADRLAGALTLRGAPQVDLRQLEQTTAAACGVPVAASRRGEPTSTRQGGAASSTGHVVPTSGVVRAMLGALLDYPGLLDDDAVQDALVSTMGDAALTVAAVARCRDDIASVVTAVPVGLRGFVGGRVVAPQQPTIEAARRVLLDNANLCGCEVVDGEIATVLAKPDESDDARLAGLYALHMRRQGGPAAAGSRR